jgi:long-chain acyl-CoA synthetase
MHLGRLLRRASYLAADQVAVFCGVQPVTTFGSLDARAGALAATLTNDLRLQRGDRVVLFATNCTGYVECLFGCWYAGLTVAPINARLHPREVAHIMRDTEAKVCFTCADLLQTAACAAHMAESSLTIVELDSPEFERMRSGPQAPLVHVDPDEIAWLFYTSGTTGRPKGAMLTHHNLLAMSLSYLVDVDVVARGDVILHAAPMSHGSGLLMLPYIAALGAQVIPRTHGFDPAEIWELIRAHRRVAMFAAPTMLDRLVDYRRKHPVADDNLKTIVVGGAPFYVEDAKRAVTSLGTKITQIYGQGETPMTISVLPPSAYADTNHPAYEARLASVGYPHSVVEVGITDEMGKLCPAGVVGEIVVKGDTVMKGYWRDPDATAAALRDGWLYTGDVGVMDGQGFLTLKGRSKDLIISGGSNIYPREIEDVLLLHPDVVEAAVVGRPHPKWGEEVVAFVVAKLGHAPDIAALDALCLDNLARFKRPKQYRIVQSLPKNAYGKVLKAALAEQLQRDKTEETHT